MFDKKPECVYCNALLKIIEMQLRVIGNQHKQMEEIREDKEKIKKLLH